MSPFFTLPQSVFSWAMLFAAIHFSGAVSALHAVWYARTSQGAIAWSLSLIFFPYLALPIYWVFGRDKFHGYVRDFQEASSDRSQIQGELRTLRTPPDPAHPHWAQIQLGYERLAQFPMTVGNHVELLIDGEETYEAIFRAMDSAREYLLIEFFIIMNDEIGKRFQQAMIRKAREGVRVYLCYDELGCFSNSSSYFRELSDAGVKVAAFAPGGWTKGRLQFNFRNHRKIVVADGEIALVGGLNISDDSLGKNPFYGAWRDTHVQLRGPAVAAIQFIFASDYSWAAGSGFPAELDWAPRSVEGGQESALYVSTGPADKQESGTNFFLHSINSARSSIWLTTPYFMPLRGVLSALKVAVLRGVEVKIIIPLRRDMLLTYLTAFSFLPDAIASGIQIYTYAAGYTHSKNMLIDKEISWIGSSNLDARSMELNFEGNLVVFGDRFAREVERMFLRDFERSEQMTIDAYENRGPLFKLGVRVARLFENVL